MKLRIQGNSLRLRISRSELARFVETGYLDDVICYGRSTGTELAYALRRDEAQASLDVDSAQGCVAVVLPGGVARAWASTDQVGIAGEVDLGPRGMLSVLVEKDFACIDRGADENADTFPNPLAARFC